AEGFKELSYNISPRAHVKGVVLRKLAPIHLEPIMVFRYRDDISCPSLSKQHGPFLWIESWSSKHGNEILIPEILVLAVSLDVMLKLRCSLNVHVSWIPFIAKGWDRIYSPVNEDPKLCVLVPSR